MYPRLILGSVIPDLASPGWHTYEELIELNRPIVDRAKNLGDRHFIDYKRLDVCFAMFCTACTSQEMGRAEAIKTPYFP